MSDQQAPAGSQPLQFDRAVPANAPADQPPGAVVCHMCKTPISTEYFHVNGAVLCERCKDIAAAVLSSPRGKGPFLRGALYGIGAAVAGAAIYYAVIALLNLEIGIVAILIGYMVGVAVRKGAGGGGRRYQVLALILTYLSVGLAYTPLGLSSVSNEPMAVLIISGAVMVVSLPVMAIIGSGASGILSAIIIGVGLQQAWRMTAAPVVSVKGPFRVGATSATQVANGA